MVAGKTYRVTKGIKVHTKPQREEICLMIGDFKKETKDYFIFDCFRVRKENFIGCVEL